MGTRSTQSSLTIGPIPSSSMQIWHPKQVRGTIIELHLNSIGKDLQVKVFWLLEVIGCLLSKGKTLVGITQRQLSSCREQASGRNSSVTKEKRWKMNLCWTGCGHL